MKELYELLHVHLHFVVVFAEPSCRAGWPIQNRGSVDANGWTAVSPDHQFSCYGQVTEWHYLGKSANGFKAIVWRPFNASDILYEVVGINDIPAGPINTPITYTVPENEQIVVMPGDMIGWSFGPSVISFNGGGDYMIRKTQGNLHASLQAHQVHDLSEYSAHREYSITASVLKKGKYFQYLRFWLSGTICCISCIS